MIPYKLGHCCGCGLPVWVKDAYGRLVRPMPHLREGYLVFENPLQYLKIPLCEDCEKNANPDRIPDYLQNVLAGMEGIPFKDRTPIRYEAFEKHWASKGKKVTGVWRWVDPKRVQEGEVDNG